MSGTVVTSHPLSTAIQSTEHAESVVEAKCISSILFLFLLPQAKDKPKHRKSVNSCIFLSDILLVCIPSIKQFNQIHSGVKMVDQFAVFVFSTMFFGVQIQTSDYSFPFTQGHNIQYVYVDDQLEAIVFAVWVVILNNSYLLLMCPTFSHLTRF